MASGSREFINAIIGKKVSCMGRESNILVIGLGQDLNLHQALKHKLKAGQACIYIHTSWRILDEEKHRIIVADDDFYYSEEQEVGEEDIPDNSDFDKKAKNWFEEEQNLSISDICVNDLGDLTIEFSNNHKLQAFVDVSWDEICWKIYQTGYEYSYLQQTGEKMSWVSHEDSLLELLIDMPVSYIGRAEGMFIMEFGKTAEKELHGEKVKRHEMILHVQTMWRIVNDDNKEIIVAEEDRYAPSQESMKNQELQPDIDELGNNLFDVKIKKWLQTKEQVTVADYNINSLGDLYLYFSNGDVLQVISASSDTTEVGESWRVFEFEGESRKVIAMNTHVEFSDEHGYCE